MLILMTLSKSLKASGLHLEMREQTRWETSPSSLCGTQSKVISEVPSSSKALCLCPCSLKVLLKGIWHCFSEKSTFEFKMN